jgi:hypothetical protein
METPSFFEKHIEKARPNVAQLKGKNLSSVFSPIPCKPQSDYSIFDCKQGTPQHVISPMSSKLAVTTVQRSMSRITPIHFLKVAEPSTSPKYLKGIQRLFG